MLKQSMGLVEKLQADNSNIEARFEPLQKQFKSLEKFEVQIEERDKVLQDSLPAAWANFRQALAEAEELIKGKKEHFKNNLLQSAEEFGRVVAQMREEFLQNIPKTTAFSQAKAFAILSDFKQQLNVLLEREAKLKQGLAIFALDPPVYKELSQSAKDLDQIEQVWKLTEEWETSWDSWKRIVFKELNTQLMEDTAQKFQKRVVKLGRGKSASSCLQYCRHQTLGGVARN